MLSRFLIHIKLYYSCEGALAAEVYNVSTLDDLTAKLASADNGDTIKVATDTYSPTETLIISKHITLSGSWNSNFTTQTLGTSILDGQSSIQILNISASADVDGFTIQNGSNTTGNGDGGGIYVSNNSKIAVNISNCTFTGNSGGAYSNHSLFKGTMDFINCTIVNNTCGWNEFYLPYAKLSLTNTLIWNDSASTRSAAAQA